MEARLDGMASPLAMKFVRHMNSAATALESRGSPATTQELVRLRASGTTQMNGGNQ